MAVALRRYGIQRVSFPLVLSFLLLTLAGPSGYAANDDSARLQQEMEAIRNHYDVLFSGTEISFQVMPLPQGRYAVIMTGEVKTEQDRKALEAQALGSMPENVVLIPRLKVKQAAIGGADKSKDAGAKNAADYWNLTYIRSRVNSTNPAASSAATSTPPKDNIDNLIDALNEVYGSKDQPAVIRAGVGRLLLRGPKTTLVEIKHRLAEIDAPWPQVQMNMWAIQVSGNAQEVATEIDRILIQVSRTRDSMNQVQTELAQIARDRYDESCCVQDLKALIEGQNPGVDFNPHGRLSLNESLILLAVNPYRQEKVRILQDWVERELSEEVTQAKGILGHEYRPFHRLLDVLDWQTQDLDCDAYKAFFIASGQFQEREKDDAPSAYMRAGATLDRHLQRTMDAFAADMNDLLLDPLLHKIRDCDSSERGDGNGRDCHSSKRREGVALTGRTRIVVTSGLEASLKPEMASVVETTRPKPFGKELLDLAFPEKAAGNPELVGANKVLAGLPDGQALLLAAGLLAETPPAYSNVAPGIEIHVRPTVLPDGGAARLTIDASFGVETSPLGTNPTDVGTIPPPAAISRHVVKADATVNAFDLFDISSFSVASTVPRGPGYVPILGRLPIVGKAFQWARSPKAVQHESMILVNTVILPRALDLARFYKGAPQGD